jgi:hypothetical protein
MISFINFKSLGFFVVMIELPSVRLLMVDLMSQLKLEDLKVL